MDEFFYCPNCGRNGPSEEIETGVPVDAFGEDDIPGGGDLDYFAHTAECCPECDHKVQHCSAEEFHDWLLDVQS